jgi:hypothetical protein
MFVSLGSKFAEMFASPYIVTDRFLISSDAPLVDPVPVPAKRQHVVWGTPFTLLGCAWLL